MSPTALLAACKTNSKSIIIRIGFKPPGHFLLNTIPLNNWLYVGYAPALQPWSQASWMSASDFGQHLSRGFVPVQLQRPTLTEMTNTTNAAAATGLTSTTNTPQVSAFVNIWDNLGMWWFSIALMFVCLIIMWLICCLKRKRARPPIYNPIIVLHPNNDGIHRLDGLKHMFFSLTVWLNETWFLEFLYYWPLLHFFVRAPHWLRFLTSK